MAEPVHILITGGSGQVGLELQALEWPKATVLHTPGRTELDLSDPHSIIEAFATVPYSAVINAGAHTAVDRAEGEVAAAFAANALGPAALADVTRTANIPLIQVSTDYVFDGLKDGPYLETDPVGPLGVYGASKLAGELAVLNGNPRSVVLRTAWVLSAHRANFLKTMLGLARDQSYLKVVADQQGCPTAARDIARTLKTIALRMISDPGAATGTYHFVNDGATTWAELAKVIFEISAARGGPTAAVERIPSSEYVTTAKRPRNSRLSTGKLMRDYGIVPRSWQDAVAEIVAELNGERDIV